jgi:hypothetical protein
MTIFVLKVGNEVGNTKPALNFSVIGGCNEKA